MSKTRSETVTEIKSATLGDPALAPAAALQRKQRRLSFTVKIVHTEDELRQAVQVRYEAYARHGHPLAERLKELESYDRDRGTVVLLARAKIDGAPLGTMRIQTNVFRPLTIEQSVELPAALQGRRLATANRLGVRGSPRSEGVKDILFKALYEFCLLIGIDWAVVAARPPLDRLYEALLFEDLFPERGLIPLRQAADLPHRIFAMKFAAAEEMWRVHHHPLYPLFFQTRCPDLDLSDYAIAFAGAVTGPFDPVVSRRR